MEESNPWVDKTIMIVDDSSVIRSQLGELYREIGMRVVGSAGDGVTAIDVFKQERPEIVSLDIIMPHMHGFDCCRKLQSLNSELLVFFVSCLSTDAALSESQSEALGGLASVQQFIPKPATRDAVEKVMAFLFGLGSQQLLDNSSPAARTSVG